jgi:hypothetical protein
VKVAAGFAGTASEVSALARRFASAAQQIKTLDMSAPERADGGHAAALFDPGSGDSRFLLLAHLQQF